ncbi:protein disulfide oxidoreductase [Anaerotalea alkaliphila]|uniref:Glutaredoxin n=1 Tax=Anaerotalea alkaliphila TaxID=2662126 RepID=A0A7X5HTW1_9FIRM|nr:thioredoxin family protein [Anaerotalea alkaliphila]NDL66590.1 glutaredoxin [Anaerotalea alkaliphila]
MNKMFTPELEEQLRQVFEGLVDDVTIALFTDGEACYSCPETVGYMREVAALSDKIHLKEYDLQRDAATAAGFKVDLAPSIVLLDAKGDYQGVKFNGIPAGHEINSFIPALLEVSGQASEVPEDLAARVDAIDKPVNIKVFVTLSCPHCPGAVQKAHKLALMNPHVEAEMVEAQTFQELSSKFNVSGVPKIVINDTYELVGNQPIQAFLDEMERI